MRSEAWVGMFHYTLTWRGVSPGAGVNWGVSNVLLFQHIWGSCQCKSGERTYISYIMHNLREIRLAVGKELVIYSIFTNREAQKCVVIEVGFFLCQMWRPVTSPVYVDVSFWQPVPTHINLLRSRFSYYWLGITHTLRSQILLLSSIGIS